LVFQNNTGIEKTLQAKRIAFFHLQSVFPSAIFVSRQTKREDDMKKPITKGIWMLHEGGTSVKAEDGRLVATCGFLPGVPVWEARANAAIIAEIPALLNSIKEAVAWIEDDRFDDAYISEEWYHKMKNILTKMTT
jgi:hypothetical protein